MIYRPYTGVMNQFGFIFQYFIRRCMFHQISSRANVITSCSGADTLISNHYLQLSKFENFVIILLREDSSSAWNCRMCHHDAEKNAQSPSTEHHELGTDLHLSHFSRKKAIYFEKYHLIKNEFCKILHKKGHYQIFCKPHLKEVTRMQRYWVVKLTYYCTCKALHTTQPLCNSDLVQHSLLWTSNQCCQMYG